MLPDAPITVSKCIRCGSCLNNWHAHYCPYCRYIVVNPYQLTLDRFLGKKVNEHKK